jgi:hypothetical protein
MKMETTPQNQRLLNWLDKEKKKDTLNVEVEKKKFIEQIKKFKKEDLIKVPKKPSIWQRIKIMIWGH